MAFKNVYLISYNLISFLLWLTILVRGSILLVSYPLPSLYDNLLSPLLTSTQSLAVLEILHASLGLVRASPLTTALQVVGKNLVVWTVMVPFPKLMTGTLIGQWGFAGCLICWSLSEVLRFGYFVVLLTSGGVPGGLKWLRYAVTVPKPFQIPLPGVLIIPIMKIFCVPCPLPHRNSERSSFGVSSLDEGTRHQRCVQDIPVLWIFDICSW